MADLRVLLDSLAKEDGVFSRVERGDAGSIEEHVYGLVLHAQEAWASYAIEGARGPASPADISGALKVISRQEALTVMTYLSAGDLVFPGRLRRDREHALHAAERVMRLMGWDSMWWTNIEPSETGHKWSPVSRFSFDGVVVGVGNGVILALLQVGED